MYIARFLLYMHDSLCSYTVHWSILSLLLLLWCSRKGFLLLASTNVHVGEQLERDCATRKPSRLLLYYCMLYKNPHDLSGEIWRVPHIKVFVFCFVWMDAFQKGHPSVYFNRCSCGRRVRMWGCQKKTHATSTLLLQKHVSRLRTEPLTT